MSQSNISGQTSSFGLGEGAKEKSTSISSKILKEISSSGSKGQERVQSDQDKEDHTNSNVSSRSTTPRPTFSATHTPNRSFPSNSLYVNHQIHQHQTPTQNSLNSLKETYRQNKNRRDSISIQSLIAPDPRSPSTYISKVQSNYHRENRVGGELLVTRREMNFGLASHHLPSPTFDHGIQRDGHDLQNQQATNLLMGGGNEYIQSPQSASGASFTSSTSFGQHDGSNLLDHDSFAALSNASKAANFGHSSEHGFDAYATDNSIEGISPYDNMSRCSSNFSLHSGLSGSELSNTAHERGNHSDTQILEGQTTHGDMVIGRTRSGTVRRYHSVSSSLSAPHRSEESVSPTGSSISLRAVSDRGRGSSTTSSIAISDSTASSSMSRKKRNKCSPEQFRQLEAFFAKNRNPTGKVREELARSIRMPERSVQVWFQNKRAKTKMNEIKEGIPPELRTTISKPRSGQNSSNSMHSRSVESDSNSSIMKGKRAITQTSSSEESVIQLPVVSLCIGAWRRIKPLICLFSRRQQAFTWYLSSESVGFKLECPRTCVTRVVFSGPRAPTIHEFSEGINTQIGHLTIELDRPPQFYMEVFRSSGASPKGKDGGEQDTTQQKASWRQCSDFTEGKQATTIFHHIISGPYVELRQAVLQLLESGGALSNVVELQDESFSSSSSSWSDTHLNPAGFHSQSSGGLQTSTSYFATSQQPLYTYHPQGGYPVSSATESAAVIGHGLEDGQFGSGHTQNQWSHTSMPSTWTSAADFTNGTAAQISNQQGYPTGGQGNHHGHLTIQPSTAHSGGGAPVVTPTSASALDMNNLRIDTGSLHSLGAAGSNQNDVGSSFEDGMNGSSYSPTWPRTAAIQPSSNWGQSLSSSQNLNESGFSSAPAYAFNSFQQQQTTQSQSQQQPAEPGSTNSAAIISDSSRHESNQNPSIDVNVAATVSGSQLHQTMFNQSGQVGGSAISSPATNFSATSSVSIATQVGNCHPNPINPLNHSGHSTIDENVMDTNLQSTAGEASNDTLRLHQSALT